ncbi:MAG: hypothetical protein MK116_09660 [Phycisphaerales bacterium]|nr:hypothetical protein [Phycisphaerales bacterium]
MNHSLLRTAWCLMILAVLIPPAPSIAGSGDSAICAIELTPGPYYSEWDSYGTAISVSGDTALVTAPGESESRGLVYVYSRSFDDGPVSANWQLTNTLFAADGQESDLFGFSVAVDGDLALVGARNDDNPNGQSAGSVYVFQRSDSSGLWYQAAKLRADDGEPSDFFGNSVSLSGQTALIGAFADDDNGLTSGSAYVFERQDDGSWDQVQKLAAFDPVANGQFGSSVSVSGDVALVGSSRGTGNVQVSGAAYVFRRSSQGDWMASAKLRASDGESFDSFGYRVSLQDDRALIGAHWDNDGGTHTGSAYIFEWDGTESWSQVAKLTAMDAGAYDQFGSSVALEGDRALVGAPTRMDAPPATPGYACVFQRDDDGQWLQVETLVPPNGQAEDGFGYALDLVEDITVIGMPGSDDNGTSSGRAYSYLVVPDSGENDCNQNGVSDTCDILVGSSPDCNQNGAPDECDIADGTSEDLNGDGIPDECPLPCSILEQEMNYDGTGDGSLSDGRDIAISGDIAAVLDWNGTSSTHEVLLYHRENGDWQLESTQPLLQSDYSIYFPFKGLDISGDTVIAGVVTEAASAVRIFRRQDGQWNQEANIPGDAESQFGISVSISGDVAVVGDTRNAEGRAVVYRRIGNYWSKQAELAPTPAPDWFANDVAVDNDTIMVSSLQQDTWVYTFDGQSWVETQQLTVDGDNVGSSVDIDGDVAAVGTYDLSSGSGLAMVFRRHKNEWVFEQMLESRNLDNSSLGFAVRADGDLIAASSGVFGDFSGNPSGKIHVFHFDGELWNEIETFEDIGLPQSWLSAPRVALSGNQVAGGFIDDAFSAFSQISVYAVVPPGNPATSDCNFDGICDTLEINAGISQDCNGNGVPDACDIAQGVVCDGDSDGIPDSCEPDCDGDLVPDDYEIEQGFEADCNGNGIPDACDVTSGSSPDENSDGVPDECDPDYLIRVAADGTAPFETIQAALVVALPGSTISVGPGTYSGTIALPRYPITLVSEDGADATIILGGDYQGAMVIANGQGSDTRVDGFTFAQGRSFDLGGGLSIVNASPEITNCTFRGNTAQRGGGVNIVGSAGEPCVFSNCRFLQNTATGDDQYDGSGGGLAAANADVLVTNSDFLANESEFTGGGLIANGGTVLLSECSFRYNRSDLPGGGATSIDSLLDVELSSFCSNDPSDLLGPWTDLGGNAFSDQCECPDANGDDQVNTDDVLAVLEGWGPCAPLADCPGDVNLDGEVNILDVLSVLSGWGTCQ